MFRTVPLSIIRSFSLYTQQTCITYAIAVCIVGENILLLLLLLLLLLTAIGLSPGGSDYFTCIQNMKLSTNKFKLGGLYEKHVVATCNVGNHLSICL